MGVLEGHVDEEGLRRIGFLLVDDFLKPCDVKFCGIRPIIMPSHLVIISEVEGGTVFFCKRVSEKKRKKWVLGGRGGGWGVGGRINGCVGRWLIA